MRYAIKKRRMKAALVAILSVASTANAHADVITDWDIKAGELVVEAKLGTPPAIRVMAMTHTAVFAALNAITGRYPPGDFQPAAAPGASVDAAVAAAHRATLSKLTPAQQAAIDAAYKAALAKVADGPAKEAGIAVGEKAAATVLSKRTDDGAAGPEAYRPQTTAGAYVPTATPAVPHWLQRRPWLMTSGAQFRPGPPPALTSDIWARGYNEVRPLAAETVAGEVPSRPRSRATGNTRCHRSITAWCARWPTRRAGT
jgi:hypothetical protein